MRKEAVRLTLALLPALVILAVYPPNVVAGGT